MFESLMEWASNHAAQWLISGVVFLLYVLVDRFGRSHIAQNVDQSRLEEGSVALAVKVTRVIVGVVGAAILTLVWGIDFHSIILAATTILTLVGVALFANWSILSNITAYFILLTQPSIKRGNFIRIIDLDNYIEGYISDIRLFNTKLLSEDREIIIYPNNLLLGKTLLVNPRNRLHVAGKLTVEPRDEGAGHSVTNTLSKP